MRTETDQLKELLTRIANAKLNIRAGRLMEAEVDIKAAAGMVGEKTPAGAKLGKALKTLGDMSREPRDSPTRALLVASVNRKLDEAASLASKQVRQKTKEREKDKGRGRGMPSGALLFQII